MAPVSATSDTVTGKSLSEALILASINPKCDDRLFYWITTSSVYEKYKFSTCCVHKLFWMTKEKDNWCTQHVLNL